MIWVLDDVTAFLAGTLIGVAVAAPVGPIALLCMRRTLTDGLPAGVATGLGAALADLLYALVAAFGIVAVTTLVMDHQRPLRLGAGLLLAGLALQIWFASPPRERPVPALAGGLGAVGTGFLLTAGNPLTLAGIFAVVAASGVGAMLVRWDLSLSLAVGIFAGSLLWWTSLCVITRRIRHLFSARAIIRLNHISAVLLALFAAYAFYTGIAGPLLSIPA